MFRGQDHVSRAEQSVGPSCENRYFFLGIVQSKFHQRAFAAANPIALHFLERIAPVNAFQAFEQALGVSGNSKHPLAHRLACDRKSADLAFTVDHFFVGEDGAQFLAPPDGSLSDIGEAIAVAFDRRQGEVIGSALPVAGLNQEL